jgi:hypothetical protein
MSTTKELIDALYDMVGQFAYTSIKWGVECLHDGGLSALENAFYALGYTDGIVRKKQFYKDWEKLGKEAEHG